MQWNNEQKYEKEIHMQKSKKDAERFSSSPVNN